MKSLTIKTYSDTKRESEFFQAILTLAGSVLSHSWRIVDSDPADVVIISFDSVEPYSAWDEYSGRYPVDRLVAYTDENAVQGAKWHLQRTPGSMPRLSEVVKILNSVGHYLSEADVEGLVAALPPHAPDVPEPVAPVGRFDLRRHLAGIIHQAVQQGQCQVCLMPGCAPVYLFPRENAVYTAADPSALSALCRADAGQINVTDLLEDELLDEVASLDGVKRRPLSEFLWFSILTGSNGRLLDGCPEDEPVHLREWPGHVRLSFYAMYHDIATHMAAGMATLGDIARKSAAPLQNVIDFHNACAFLGLVVRGEEGRRLAGQKAKSRDHLRTALKPCCAANGYIKLVIVGSVGAGKTTALTTLSETPPILTEASPSDTVAALKATTTVAMEYGEIRIDNDAKLQIYGTPGQRRFDFMGQILCGRAWGLMILIDNTQPDPLAELKYYIDMYAETFSGGNVVVGISHYDAAKNPSVEDYEDFLADKGHRFGVGIVDTRDSSSLALLVASLATRRGAEDAPRHFF
jgi:hypothetical protein